MEFTMKSVSNRPPPFMEDPIPDYMDSEAGSDGICNLNDLELDGYGIYVYNDGYFYDLPSNGIEVIDNTYDFGNKMSESDALNMKYSIIMALEALQKEIGLILCSVEHHGISIEIKKEIEKCEKKCEGLVKSKHDYGDYNSVLEMTEDASHRTLDYEKCKQELMVTLRNYVKHLKQLEFVGLDDDNKERDKNDN